VQRLQKIQNCTVQLVTVEVIMTDLHMTAPVSNSKKRNRYPTLSSDSITDDTASNALAKSHNEVDKSMKNFKVNDHGAVALRRIPLSLTDDDVALAAGNCSYSNSGGAPGRSSSISVVNKRLEPLGNTTAAVEKSTAAAHEAVARLYFDGGSLGNPGKSGAGYQLFDSSGSLITQSAVRMKGICTNNQAEYVGLIHGVKAALHHQVTQLHIFGDSELVIRQMTRVYKVKNPTLKQLHLLCDGLCQQFPSVKFEWIDRSRNIGADALSKQAMHHDHEALEEASWFNS
jgi:ribonuclease HI